MRVREQVSSLFFFTLMASDAKCTVSYLMIRLLLLKLNWPHCGHATRRRQDQRGENEEDARSEVTVQEVQEVQKISLSTNDGNGAQWILGYFTSSSLARLLSQNVSVQTYKRK